MDELKNELESEYFNFKLNQWIKNNPNLDIGEEVRKTMLFKSIRQARVKDNSYLFTIDEEIPNDLIRALTDLMADFKGTDTSKYAMYRACEDFLVKTNWFIELDPNKQFQIRHDFYKVIILGIHVSLSFPGENQNEEISKHKQSFIDENNMYIKNETTSKREERKVRGKYDFINRSYILQIMALLTSIGISVFLGYYFKKPNSKTLLTMWSQKSEWRKNIYENYARSRNSLFSLEDFDFNWSAMILSLILLSILFLIIKKYFNPFPNFGKAKK